MISDLQLSGFSLFSGGNGLKLSSALIIIPLAFWLYSRFTHSSISELDGPPKSHWLLGNLTEVHLEDVGDPQLSWQRLYGSAFKMHGLFGEESLMISDPMAVKHVCAASDDFSSRSPGRHIISMLTGPGLIAVEGDAHKRHRRVTQPAFGVAQLKTLFPIFIRRSRHLSDVLKKDIDAQSNGRIAKLDMHSYVWKTALDIVGEAAFHYDFSALDNKQDTYKDVLNNVRSQSLECTSTRDVFIHHITTYLPSWMVYFVTRLPIQKFTAIHAMHDISVTFANRLVKEMLHAYEQGLEGSKDLISLLVRANAVEKQQNKLSDREIESEVNTFVLAAQESTTNSISFGLWELARDVGMQQRIRREILDMKKRAAIQDNIDFYEQMPILNAFIKEVLRYHPVAFYNFRDATRDTVIPLSKPVKSRLGRLVNEIPVSKGLKIWINMLGYNRLPELFGPDADEFNMDRWLDTSTNNNAKISQGVGLYANLATFGHGSRSCIGWRFALWEMQVIFVNLLYNFEFTTPVDGKIRRAPAFLMYPTLEGTRGAPPSMSLNVSVLQD